MVDLKRAGQGRRIGTVTVLAAMLLVVGSAVPPLAASAPAAASTLAADGPVTAALDSIPDTFYVAAAGDDSPANPCIAINSPCLTVGAAISRAVVAITDGAVDVTVNIAAGTYTENVGIGAVPAGHSLSLIGAAASATTIRGLGTASVIGIASGVVNIGGLSITGGSAVNGGGIYNNDGTLTLSGSTVSGNTGTSTGATQGGGGIYNNTGTLSVSNSTVSGNTATGLTASLGGGAGIFNNDGTLNVSASTVSGNTAVTGYAGGIFNNTGTVSVSDSTLSGNRGWYAGGIHNRGTLNVSDSTVSGNTSTNNFGGGISNLGAMTVANSTLSGNTALNLNTGKGGAIYNKGLATVTNSTLSGNSAYQGGGIFTQSKLLTVANSTLSGNTHTVTLAGAVRPGGGIWVESSPNVNVSNSILSGSSCNQKYAAVDGGYNVVDDSSCFTAIGPTSIQNSTTIGLASLAANGSTGPQSMAIDSSSSAHHLVPGCTGTDKRGLPRPGFGGAAHCDAGAYELQAAAPLVTTDPQSQNLAIGSDATFTAAASGAPKPTVRWQVNTGSAWADVPGATTTTLTLTGVTHAMTGNRYRAVFANGVAQDATTAAATLTVPVGALQRLELTPSSATFVSGGSQLFTAEGFDSSGNSLGDVTAATVFTGTTGMECTAALCTSALPGTYQITGTRGPATGTATLTVTAAVIPAVNLPAGKPLASGPMTGVPATISPGEWFTATATGFAPHAPITFGIYSTVLVLGQVTADSTGTAVARLQTPSGFTGSHTVVAGGMSPSMTPRFLETSIIVAASPGSAARALATTGVHATLSHLSVLGVVFLAVGSLIAVAAPRRRIRD